MLLIRDCILRNIGLRVKGLKGMIILSVLGWREFRKYNVFLFFLREFLGERD